MKLAVRKGRIGEWGRIRESRFSEIYSKWCSRGFEEEEDYGIEIKQVLSKLKLYEITLNCEAKQPSQVRLGGRGSKMGSDRDP